MTARPQLQAEVEATYRAMTPGSEAIFRQAQDALPGGDSRNSTYYKPYPVVIDNAYGTTVEDVDGNRYFDAINCASTMILGYGHPAVLDAVNGQVARGTAYGAANRHAPELAGILKDRIPSIEKLRFTNSGTEAVMMCVRAARASTGRPKILKMTGSYHGSHDDFEVSGGHGSPGIMPTADQHILEVQYNDKSALVQMLDAHAQELAAVIVEGIMGSCGMIPPEDGYLAFLRAETEARGILLILDEVISLRLSPGGAQELYGIRPDLTAMGKIIGGGLPVGAFGGREDLMMQFSPLNEGGFLRHSGTFNANPVTMAAGVAAMRELDADQIGYLNRLGERFAQAVRAAAVRRGTDLLVTGAGSLRNLHFAAEPPRHGAAAYASDKRLMGLLHLRLLTEGFLLGRGGWTSFSTVTTEKEVDTLVEAIDRALAWMQ